MRPMTSQLDFLLDMHERLRAKIADEEVELDARCAQLRGELDKCEQERGALAKRLWALEETERLYRADLGLQAHDSPPSGMVVTPHLSGSGGQLRARIGPKRYLMLAALRDFGALAPESVTNRTGIEPRRVKA